MSCPRAGTDSRVSRYGIISGTESNVKFVYVLASVGMIPVWYTMAGMKSCL